MGFKNGIDYLEREIRWLEFQMTNVNKSEEEIEDLEMEIQQLEEEIEDLELEMD
mgnify:CR=1 FL=1